MVGTIDEFRGEEDGRLVAWCQTIAKGKTIRGMWYYCVPNSERWCIWFFCVRLNLARAIRLGLHHVDAGPSDNTGVAKLKRKYGFELAENWHDVVDYAGAFVPIQE